MAIFTMNACRALPAALLKTGQVLRLSPADRIRFILLPSAPAGHRHGPAAWLLPDPDRHDPGRDVRGPERSRLSPDDRHRPAEHARDHVGHGAADRLRRHRPQRSCWRGSTAFEAGGPKVQDSPRSA
ncbi:MAG: hypothetical protein WDN45_01910 [Caulobacteraceae bacterium]